MKIYHVREEFQERWRLDPVLGPQKVREAVLQPSGFSALVHGDKKFQPDATGTFEVPDEVGRELVRRVGWHEGIAPSFEASSEAPAPRRRRGAE